jgi:hypothetical protein
MSQSQPPENPMNTAQVLRFSPNRKRNSIYRVFADNNFLHVNNGERTANKEFATLASAIDACRKIVDDFLASTFTPGISAEDLYSYYKMFGEDPWISGADGVPFSAWDYAGKRCVELCRQTN